MLSQPDASKIRLPAFLASLWGGMDSRPGNTGMSSYKYNSITSIMSVAKHKLQGLDCLRIGER